MGGVRSLEYQYMAYNLKRRWKEVQRKALNEKYKGTVEVCDEMA